MAHNVQGEPKTWHFTFVHVFANLLIDFQNSFTGTLRRKFAITWLLHIPPQRKCISTPPCKISTKYAYITIITNKHFGKIEKKNISDKHCDE